MATSPQFTSAPRIGLAAISVANANRDGTGTIVDVLTGTTNGTRISEVVVMATGTTTAGMVRFFIDDGTNVRLFDEVLIAAVTPSATVAAFRALRAYDYLVLPSTWKLRASTNNAETFVVEAFGGDF